MKYLLISFFMATSVLNSIGQTGDKVRHIKHGTPRFGIFTWVLEKQNGKWLIIASQNTEIIPPLPGQ